MTAENVERFKITATTSANWVIPARTQEDKQKKNSRHARTLTHTRSDTFAPWPTGQLARTHTSTLLTRLGKKKTQVHALRFKKKKKEKKIKKKKKKKEKKKKKKKFNVKQVST